MYVPIEESEEEESDAGEENDPILNEEQQQDDENEARWIPPGQDFAVVIWQCFISFYFIMSRIFLILHALCYRIALNV